jgi:hypothetical protein
MKTRFYEALKLVEAKGKLDHQPWMYQAGCIRKCRGMPDGSMN